LDSGSDRSASDAGTWVFLSDLRLCTISSTNFAYPNFGSLSPTDALRYAYNYLAMDVNEPTLHGTCVACPKCGVWIVTNKRIATPETGNLSKVTCPECNSSFSFENDRAKVYPLRQSIYERGFFYPSELRHP